MNRRFFLNGVIAVAAAPAIVRAESLMKIFVPPKEILTFESDFLRLISINDPGGPINEVYKTYPYQIEMMRRLVLNSAFGKLGVGQRKTELELYAARYLK